jgi:hypothetical protein
VIDQPGEIVLRAVDHAAVRRLCDGCGGVSAGAFPAEVRAPVEYGPRIRAFGVHLYAFQHVPYDRVRRRIFDLTGVNISTGTPKAWVDRAVGGLCEFDEQLRVLLGRAPVVNFHETGARIAGRLGWIHSSSTPDLTRYTAHARRARRSRTG